MDYSKQLKSYKGSVCVVKFSSPNTCPMCNSSIEPIFVEGFIESEDHASVSFVCPACHKMFIARYSLQSKENFQCVSYLGTFLRSEPEEAIFNDFTPEIRAISSRFVTVWNQAHQAEEYGLDEICGLGYRKSLEILIKDFCILINPEDSDDISNEFHMDKLIRKYLSGYAPIQDISKVAFWFGNNEAHYRNDADPDNIENLKKYIDAVVGCVNIEAIYGSAAQRLADLKK